MRQLQIITTFAFLMVSGSTFAQESDTLSLSLFGGSDTVSVGQIIEFTGHVHSSVGKEIEVKVGRYRIVSFVDSEIVYKNDETKEMSGGDAAWKTFLFRAESAGQTKIIIQEIFRGEVTHESETLITVIE